MAADLDVAPWWSAWQGQDAVARLQAFGRDFAGIAAEYFRSVGSPLEVDAPRGDPADQYRRLFTPPAGLAGAATSARLEAAVRRSGELAGAIAIDAARRLTDALADPDPAATQITSLRQLHELWVECGEAAYAEAAHRADFADAQAELLASLVELRAGPPR